MPEFKDVEIGRSGRGGPTSSEMIEPGGRPARQPKDVVAGGQFDVVVDEQSIGGGAEAPQRRLSESVQKRISALKEMHRAVEEEEGKEPDEKDPDDPDVAAQADQDGDDDDEKPESVEDDPDDPDRSPGDAAVADTPATAKKVEPQAKEPDDEIRALVDRQRALIERYRADLETARSEASDRVSSRAKMLEDAIDRYHEDPAAAIRQYLAAVLDVDSPDHDAVKEELPGLYLDLTSAVTGANIAPEHKAERTSVLTKRAFVKEKRRREAESKTATDRASRSEQEKQIETAVNLIDESLKLDAAKFPLISRFATLLDGKNPGRVVWEALDAGVANGDIHPYDASGKMKPDSLLIAEASKLAESKYQRRADEIRAALQPSPTEPTGKDKKPTQTAKNGTTEKRRQSHGTPGLSNADASVAPATKPAKPTTNDKPKTFKSAEDRMRWATRHIRKPK